VREEQLNGVRRSTIWVVDDRAFEMMVADGSVGWESAEAIVLGTQEGTP